jgi:ADP-ribose pyrophosphatase YjhB (NUDIX family)
MNREPILAQSLQDIALPHFVVSCIVYNPKEKTMLLMWRTDKVRSAKNCWSIPSGLFEHGETFESAIFRELQEELGLERPRLHRLQFHTLYNNLPGDGFHWVVGIWSVACTDLSIDSVVNHEPDKHQIVILPLTTVHDMLSLELEQQVTVFEPRRIFGGNLAAPLVESLNRIISTSCTVR